MEKRDIDVQIISGGVASMPEEQQEKVKDIVRAMYRNFPDLFDYPEDGETEQNTQKSCQRMSVHAVAE